VTHYAHVLPFKHLMWGLEKEVELGNINKRVNGPLTQYTYSKSCVYTGAWNDYTTVARGLIVDDERIVATPFPKFFNLGERNDYIPDRPFEVYEKVDGSLIILFWYDGEWRTATKGSFNSSQAQWAHKKLYQDQMALDLLDRDVTYLLEAVYPENRIVVSYPEEQLVILGGYRNDGTELGYMDLFHAAAMMGARVVRIHKYEHFSQMVEEARALPLTHEGFVVRFEGGYRLKIKADEYTRVHRLISGVTPLGIWEAIFQGDDLGGFRRQLPEEFWADFDAIRDHLMNQVLFRELDIKEAVEKTAHLTDKELGLMLHTFPEEYRGYVPSSSLSLAQDSD
jgi:RNA ligase